MGKFPVEHLVALARGVVSVRLAVRRRLVSLNLQLTVLDLRWNVRVVHGVENDSI